MAENKAQKAYTSFLGRGWSFPPEFIKSATGEVRMTENEQDIDGSLKLLLGTAVGERFMQPKYGLNMQEILFEPLNTTMKTYIKGLIKQAILFFEPRIDLNTVTIQEDNQIEGRINVIIEYTIRATNSRYNIVFPFYQKA